MPTRILDTGLTAQQEERLIADWTECCRVGDALLAELEHPTFSRRFETQINLWREARDQGDRCHSLLVALRERRKARQIQTAPPPDPPQ
jgi:hypothetical protein